MNILVLGYGSIGKRHAQNLIDLGHKVKVYDPEWKKVPRELLELDLREIDSEVIFICTPTSTHDLLIQDWRAKHLFIEKPLVDSGADLERIRSMKVYGTDMVACNMRFEPLIQRAYEIIKEGKIGTVFSVKVDFGYYLPYWRPGVDYKQVEIPGVVLDCIHEIDLLRWFHGDPDEVGASQGISNYFGIANVDAILRWKNGLVANIHMDYLRREKKRVIEWVGSEGTLTYVENKSLRIPGGPHKLFWITKDGDCGVLESDKDHNYPYVKQLEHFFECIEKNKKTCNPIEEATKTTELALRIQYGDKDSGDDPARRGPVSGDRHQGPAGPVVEGTGASGE